MTKLFLVKDGIYSAKLVNTNNDQIFDSNYFAITYGLRRNEGYIDKKNPKTWKLYTQVGQTMGSSRYYYLDSFELCISKLEELSGCDIVVLSQKQYKSIIIM